MNQIARGFKKLRSIVDGNSPDVIQATIEGMGPESDFAFVPGTETHGFVAMILVSGGDDPNVLLVFQHVDVRAPEDA